MERSEPDHADPPETPPHRWLIDGFNVLHAVVLKGRERSEWWREPARERLLELVRRFDPTRDGRTPSPGAPSLGVPSLGAPSPGAPSTDAPAREACSRPVREVIVVFDGTRPEPEPPSDAASDTDPSHCPSAAALPPAHCEPAVVFAASADDWIAAEVRGSEQPGTIAVVTSDRQLAARVRHRGGRIVRPTAFAALCSAEVQDSSPW